MPSIDRPDRASRRLRPLALAGLLLLAPFASAQDAPRIEQQMSAEQFRNAGLDQLSPAQLESLNEWLSRTVDAEAGKATRMAEDRIQQQNRGLLGSGSNEPVTGRLQGTFDGFGKGRTYTLDNGQQWRQTDSATLSSVHLENPSVRIAPSLVGSNWYLQVEGYNTRAKVQRVK